MAHALTLFLLFISSPFSRAEQVAVGCQAVSTLEEVARRLQINPDVLQSLFHPPAGTRLLPVQEVPLERAREAFNEGVTREVAENDPNLAVGAEAEDQLRSLALESESLVHEGHIAVYRHFNADHELVITSCFEILSNKSLTKMTGGYDPDRLRMNSRKNISRNYCARRFDRLPFAGTFLDPKPLAASYAGVWVCQTLGSTN